MHTVIRGTFLPYEDAEETRRFYGDALGLEVGEDRYGGGRRIVLSHAGGAGAPVALEALPQTGRGDAGIALVTDDVGAAFDSVLATGAEVVQEPRGGPDGVRRCAFFDPGGNLVRIQEPASGAG